MKLLGLKTSQLLLFISLVCFAWVIFLTWLRYTPVSLSFVSLPGIDGTTQYVSEKDFSLSISEQNMYFDVTSAKVEKNRWPLSKTGLIHISSTPLPGETGNSIIYGHNWPNLLGNLHSVKTGQKITVKINSQEHVFVITSVAKVSPHDGQLLKNTSTSVLTIYTCTGFLDSERLVVTADKIS